MLKNYTENGSQDLCKAATDSQPMACCGRQSGKAVLKDIIHRHRRKADNLQALVNMLPEQPTPEQDQQLWELACSMER